jgi:hypothetical protein
MDNTEDRRATKSHCNHSPQKKRDDDAPLGYSGRSTIRLEGAVWHVNPLLGYTTEFTQPVSKHQPVYKISSQTRWRHATVLEYGSYATCRGDVTRQQE